MHILTWNANFGTICASCERVPHISRTFHHVCAHMRAKHKPTEDHTIMKDALYHGNDGDQTCDRFGWMDTDLSIGSPTVHHQQVSYPINSI